MIVTSISAYDYRLFSPQAKLGDHSRSQVQLGNDEKAINFRLSIFLFAHSFSADILKIQAIAQYSGLFDEH